MAQDRSEFQALIVNLQKVVLPALFKNAPNFIQANQKFVKIIQALDVKDDKQIYDNRQAFIELQGAVEAFLSPRASSNNIHSAVRKLLGMLIFPENIRQDLKLLDTLLEQISIMPKIHDRNRTEEEVKKELDDINQYIEYLRKPLWKSQFEIPSELKILREKLREFIELLQELEPSPEGIIPSLEDIIIQLNQIHWDLQVFAQNQELKISPEGIKIN